MAQRRTGQRSRLIRARHRLKLTQERMADRIRLDGLPVALSTYKRWEAGDTQTIQLRWHPPLAKALKLDDPDEIDWYLVRDDELIGSIAPYAAPAVDRRDFVTGTAALAAAHALPIPTLTSNRISGSDVARLRAAIQTLQELDDLRGGGAAFGHALDHLEYVQQLLNTATYSTTVGRDLRVLAGEITDMAGWLAYDAGDQSTARRLWTEALCAAQLTANDRLVVMVMTDMSIQAARHGQPREAIALTEGARRTARPFATPRLLSLLAAREARAHALLGDVTTCHRMLWEAEQLLEEGQHPDDEEWLAFWGPADFNHHAALAHAALGAPRDAERAGRSAVAAVDSAHPRNAALYLAALAQSLIQQGNLEEAAAQASGALRRLPSVSSGRLRTDLQAIGNKLKEHPEVPEAETYVGELATALS